MEDQDEVIEDPAQNDALIGMQPAQRVIRGIVRINFQALQLRTCMLASLLLTMVNQRFNITNARIYFAANYNQLILPCRQAFARLVYIVNMRLKYFNFTFLI